MSDPMNDPNAAPPAIELIGVTRRYPDGDVTAIDDLSLSITAGEYVAVVGPSGSGKSTLLNVIGCLDAADSGTLCIDGDVVDPRTDRDQLRSKKFGFVFQSFHLIATLDARDNVLLPMMERPMSMSDRRRRAAELLTEVGLEHRQSHLPSRLSVGERQRVAIARALANDPAILLADEPTGSLDSKNGEAVMRLFDAIRQRREVTIVMITHDDAVAAAARRRIRIEDGRIIEDRST